MPEHAAEEGRARRPQRRRPRETGSQPPTAADGGAIPYLQQTAGNQAVQRLIREGRLSGTGGLGRQSAAVRRAPGALAPSLPSVPRLRSSSPAAASLQRDGPGGATTEAPTAEARAEFAREQQRYVTDAIDFIRAGERGYRVVVPGSPPLDAARIRTQLDGWLRTVRNTQRILDAMSGVDADLVARLRTDLRQTYVGAVQTLVNAAAGQQRRSQQAVYQEFRDSIHEWAYASADQAASELTSGLSQAERQRIRVVTASVTIPGVHDMFSTQGGSMTIPIPEGATVRYAGAIADQLQHGLRNVAGELTTRQHALELNSTITLVLDLTEFGAGSSIYRFTYVEHPAASGQPATREILIERQGAVAVEGLSREQTQATRQRFEQHGFRRGRGWSEAEFSHLLDAISAIPDSMLTPVDGLVFARESAHPTRPEVGGDYDPDTHTIRLFDRAFTASQTRVGTPEAGLADEATRSIEHEIGHAIDLLPLRQAWARLESAQQALRAAFAEYEDPPDSGHYSFPNTEQARWNQLQAAITAAETARGQARSGSGYRWQAGQGGEYEIVQGSTAAGNSAFRQAAAQDGGVRVTRYSDEEWQEYFAESFSLYRSAPGQLQQLRPRVYAYFVSELPAQ